MYVTNCSAALLQRLTALAAQPRVSARGFSAANCNGDAAVSSRLVSAREGRRRAIVEGGSEGRQAASRVPTDRPNRHTLCSRTPSAAREGRDTQESEVSVSTTGGVCLAVNE